MDLRCRYEQSVANTLTTWAALKFANSVAEKNIGCGGFRGWLQKYGLRDTPLSQTEQRPGDMQHRKTVCWPPEKGIGILRLQHVEHDDYVMHIKFWLFCDDFLDRGIFHCCVLGEHDAFGKKHNLCKVRQVFSPCSGGCVCTPSRAARALLVRRPRRVIVTGPSRVWMVTKMSATSTSSATRPPFVRIQSICRARA